MDDDRYNTGDTAAELAALRQRLAEVEQQTHTTNKRTATRLAHLQSVTAALLATLTADQVATVVIEQAIPTLGAYAGGLALLDADGTALHIAHITGYCPMSSLAGVTSRSTRRCQRQLRCASERRCGSGSRAEWAQALSAERGGLLS